MTFSKILIIVSIIGVSTIVAFVTIGYSSVYKTFKIEVNTLLEKTGTTSKDLITEADIQHLPEPVQRYLRYTGIIGKERIHTVRLKQQGQIRMKPEDKWMPIEAEEYYTVDKPSFVWYGKAKIFPFLAMTARDKYIDGKGNMWIKLTPFITIANETGPGMDQGSLMRYFNEMMWFPTAFLHENITWETIDDTSVKATIHDHGHKESCTLYINEHGQLTNFVAKRYREDTMDTWSTPLTKYGEFHGLRLPLEGEAVWHLESGDFSYIKLTITDIEYNVAGMY